MSTYHKEYYLKNKEHLLEKQRLWRKNNPDKVKAQKKKHYLKHIEYYRELDRNNPNKNKNNYNYRKRNPYSVKATNTKQVSGMEISKEVVQSVYEDNIKIFGTLTCYICLNKIQFGKDCIEHKTPYSRGGSNEYDNLGIACGSCNSKKRNKTIDEYLEVIKK